MTIKIISNLLFLFASNYTNEERLNSVSFILDRALNIAFNAIVIN